MERHFVSSRRRLLAAATRIGAAALFAGAPAFATPRRLIDADPSNYFDRLATLKPGDTLRLAAGDYGVDALGRDIATTPGLPIFGLHGTMSPPIARATSRAIVSPSPVPSEVAPLVTCVNARPRRRRS